MKRYDIIGEYVPEGMGEVEDGEYVRFEDVQPLIDALKKIRGWLPIGHETSEMTLDRLAKYAAEALAKLNEPE